MNRYLAIILFFCLSTIRPAYSAEWIKATISITNLPTDGATVVIKASTRTWKTTVATSANQILIGATIPTSATNMFNHFALYPVSGVLQSRVNVTNLVYEGYGLTATVSANWASVVLVTNTTVNNYTVAVPFSNMGATNRHIIGNFLISDLNDYASTNQLNQNANVTQQLVGLTNAQAIAGNKNFSGTNTITNTANMLAGTITNSILTNITLGAGTITGRFTNSGLFIGGTITNVSITNAEALGGNVTRFTNGGWINPLLTNGINYGNAFSSRGSASNSEQFGASATAAATDSTVVGSSAAVASTATGGLAIARNAAVSANSTYGVAIGYGALVDEDSPYGTALGSSTTVNPNHTNVTVIGYLAESTGNNQVVLGSSTVNQIYTPGRIEAAGGYTNALLIAQNTNSGGWSFSRTNNTALANGNNANINTGTSPNEKTYIKVSGPTASFNVNGFAGGRDGRVLEVQNSTGHAMTIMNDSGVDPAAENRIYTGSNADITYTNNPTLLTFIYDSAVSRWILKTVTGTSVAGITGSGSNTRVAYFTSPTELSSDATFVFDASIDQLNLTSLRALYITNAGNFTNIGGITNAGGLTNVGLVVFNGGVTNFGNFTNVGGMTNSGAFTNGGDLFVKSGAQITSDVNVGGSISVSGEATAGAFIGPLVSTYITNFGTFTNIGGITNSGAFTNVGMAVFKGGITNFGTFTNVGGMTNSGAFTNGGNLWVRGSLTVDSGVSFDGDDIHSDGGGNLTVAGGLNLSGGFTNTGIANFTSITNFGNFTNIGGFTNSGGFTNIGLAVFKGGITNFGTITNIGGITNFGNITNVGTLTNSGNVNFGASLVVVGVVSADSFVASTEILAPFAGIDGDCTIAGTASVGTLTVSGGVAPNAGGFKHKRVSTGSIGAGASAVVTVTWDSAFGDANYTPMASVLDTTAAAASLRVVHIENQTAASITVRVENTSAGSISGTLNAIALHD